MVDTLQAQDLKQYQAEVAQVLAKVNRALGLLGDSGQTGNLGSGEVDQSGDSDYLESAGDAPRTLAS
jgi:hypothetical protein